jgi:hypothetical protein
VVWVYSMSSGASQVVAARGVGWGGWGPELCLGLAWVGLGCGAGGRGGGGAGVGVGPSVVLEGARGGVAQGRG